MFAHASDTNPCTALQLLAALTPTALYILYTTDRDVSAMRTQAPLLLRLRESSALLNRRVRRPATTLALACFTADSCWCD